MNHKKYIVFLLVFAIAAMSLSQPVKAFYIGASPSFIDLGVLEPGSNKMVDLYLTTNSDEDIELNIICVSVSPTDIDLSRNFSIAESSQQGIYGWVSYPENPVVMKAAEKNRKVSFIFNVPENAEPGYHSFGCSFSPYIPEGASSSEFRAVVVTTVRVNMIFRIPGNAVRSGYVLGFDSTRESYREEMISVLIKNNGTVSMYVNGYIDVYKNGERLFGDTITSEYSSPGKITRHRAIWSSKNLTEGIYDIKANMTWIVGKNITGNDVQYIILNSIKEGSVEVQKLEQPAEVIQQQAEKQDIPWIFILIPIIIIIIGVVLYRRYKD